MPENFGEECLLKVLFYQSGIKSCSKNELERRTWIHVPKGRDNVFLLRLYGKKHQSVHLST